jgi:peptidoglycan/xylan/chitin deacetylase (PgdA/CDA1 family)
MYHIVDDAIDDVIAVSESSFESQMSGLCDQGFSVLTMNQAIRVARREERAPDRAVLITFDDGYADNVHTALPILARYRLPATLFVPTAYVGQLNRWNPRVGYDTRHATWDELRCWVAAGLEVGGHAHDHTRMNRLGESELGPSLDRNKRTLEAELGVEVRAFAYPYGYFTDGAKSAVQERYDIAFSVDDGVWCPWLDRYAINRMGVWPGCSAAELFHAIARVLRAARQ